MAWFSGKRRRVSYSTRSSKRSGPDVFINYARFDRELAAALAQALGEEGLEGWWDAEIEPGLSFSDVIREQIENATWMVAVWTRASSESRFFLSQARVALEKGNLIPVVSGGVQPPEPFDQLQSIAVPDINARLFDLAPTVKALLHTMGYKRRKPPSRDESEGGGVVIRNRGASFLSHAEKDREFVDELIQFMERRDYGYWEYDTSDRNYQSKLFEELESRIERAQLMICILSERWRESDWCIKEYFFGREIRKPIFLIKPYEMSPTLAIAGEPYIDFTQDRSKGFAKLAEQLDNFKL
ncbi:MAG: toll/interleukin-1 receptor domain-containing protein [Pseudomonadota bacterium]